MPQVRMLKSSESVLQRSLNYSGTTIRIPILADNIENNPDNITGL